MFSHSPVNIEYWITGLGFFPFSFLLFFSLTLLVKVSNVTHMTVLFWSAVFFQSFVLLPSQPCRTAFQPAERECFPLVSPASVWSSDWMILKTISHSNIEMWMESSFFLQLALLTQFKRMAWNDFYFNVCMPWFQGRAEDGCEKLPCYWSVLQNYVLPVHC